MTDLSFFSRGSVAEDEIRRHRPRKRAEVKPRVLAVRALHSLKFGSVCPGEGNDGANLGRLIAGTMTLAGIGGLIVWQVLVGRLHIVVAVVLVAALAGVLIGLQMLGLTRPRWSASVLLALWVAAILHGTALRGVEGFLLVFLLPIAVTAGLRASARAVVLMARVPAFVPAALVLVLAPLFTEDPWRFVAVSRERIVLLGALAVLPLLAMVLWRVRRLPLEPIFRRAGGALVADRARAIEMSWGLLRNRVLTTEHRPLPEVMEPFLRRGFQEHRFAATVEELRTRADGDFRRLSLWRVLTLLTGTTTVTFALIYLMAVATMPVALAEDWSKTAAWSFSLDGIGVAVSVPLWPYAGVAGLFAIVAAVGFLALILTEESYTTKVVDAVYGRLATLVIAVGAPLLADGRGPVRSPAAASSPAASPSPSPSPSPAAAPSPSPAAAPSPAASPPPPADEPVAGAKPAAAAKPGRRNRGRRR